MISVTFGSLVRLPVQKLKYAVRGVIINHRDAITHKPYNNEPFISECVSHTHWQWRSSVEYIYIILTRANTTFYSTVNASTVLFNKADFRQVNDRKKVSLSYIFILLYFYIFMRSFRAVEAHKSVNIKISGLYSPNLAKHRTTLLN